LRRRWELQWKGSGPTPFCRGADGRAVVRSSIREFLASEFMAACGVPTTRAVATIAAGLGEERAVRPWYEAGEERMGWERCAITTRAAPSFVRVGHFEIWARRMAGALPGSKPEEARERLHELLAHAISREYPDVAARFGMAGGYSVQEAGKAGGEETVAEKAVRVPDEAILAFLEAVMGRLSDMIGGWMNVGYVQSNFNSDNVLVGGRTMDYGPFGYVDAYDPDWVMWIGGGKKFAFAQQPLACTANFATLASSVAILISDDAVLETVKTLPKRLLADLQDTVAAVWRRKLGFTARGTGDAAADAVWAEIGPQLAENVLDMLHVAEGDWTIFWRRLADLAKALDAPPLAAVDFESPGAAEEPRVAAALLAPLEDAWYGPLSGENSAMVVVVLVRWAAAIRRAGGEGSAGSGAAAAARMVAVSPRYVPREHLLVEAYSAVKDGDLAPLQRLQEVLLNPFEDGTAEQQREFDVKTPGKVRKLPGVCYMSCSS